MCATHATTADQYHAFVPEARFTACTVSPVIQAPVPDSTDIRYTRPAGAFTGYITMKDGVITSTLGSPMMQVKPYVQYDYRGYASGTSDNSQHYWWHTLPGTDENGYELTQKYGIEQVEAPMWVVVDGDMEYRYQLGDAPYVMEAGVMLSPRVAQVISYPTFGQWVQDDAEDLLVSSKTFNYAEIQGQRYLQTYYSGCNHHGNNAQGWWFGKNGGTNGHPIDGIAQAFERPSHPYLLKQVVMTATQLQVTSPVVMTCKIYRLESIPTYHPTDVAILPAEPGTLIATGKATLTPEMTEDQGIVFDLYREQDGIEFHQDLTVDYPILVVVDGYNAPEMDALVDFTALISADMHTDEGYGELAYLKYGHTDGQGNFTGEYSWIGLNNFFGSEMKTGFTLFLTVDQPYLAFSSEKEDGEYVFPTGGGNMGYDLLSWYPSEDLSMTDRYGDDLPDWLTVELIDDVDGKGGFNHIIHAVVTAAPLPDGLSYREAVIDINGPGCTLSYTFRQSDGTGPEPLLGDVNGDGEVTISDVNALINIILGRGLTLGSISMTNPADVNGDGEVNIGDINRLIDIILGL